MTNERRKIKEKHFNVRPDQINIHGVDAKVIEIVPELAKDLGDGLELILQESKKIRVVEVGFEKISPNLQRPQLKDSNK